MHEVAALLEGHYADRKKVPLLPDSLTPHTPGTFYAALEPKRATHGGAT